MIEGVCSLKTWLSLSPCSGLSVSHLWQRLLLISTPFFACPSLLLAKGKYFDEQEYSLSASFKTPMDTIAGLTDWGQQINHVYGLTTIIVTLVFFAVSIPLVLAII